VNLEQQTTLINSNAWIWRCWM